MGSRVRVVVICGEGEVLVIGPVGDDLVVWVGGVVAAGSSVVIVACTGGRAAGRPLTASSERPRSSCWAPRLNARAALMVPTMTAPPRAASGGRRDAPIRRVSVTERRTAGHAATSPRVRSVLQPCLGPRRERRSSAAAESRSWPFEVGVNRAQGTPDGASPRRSSQATAS